MSEVRLVIRDAERDRSGTIHGSMADRVVAALSADPATIEELDSAIDRFAKPSGTSHFGWFHAGIDDEPWDAGLVIVDLAARLVVVESAYSSPGKDGRISYHDGTCGTNVGVRYRLNDDWLISYDIQGWQHRAEERRRERAAAPPLDARQVLYGQPVVEFIAAEVWRAFISRPPAAPVAEPGEPFEVPDDIEYRRDADDYRLIREIHVRWMMTPQDVLRGQCPRDVMQTGREYVSHDLDSRCHQWSYLGFCPPGLSPESHAFRYAGFGTHEHVMYYYLLRQLLWTCRDRVAALAPEAERRAWTVGDFQAEEVPRLAAARDAWLDGPNHEYHGRTPRSIIDRERARLPEAVGAADIIDHDCPLCQMMADEMHGPTFWHLDGCNMDDDFAFSYLHATLEEWQEQQREWEEMDRKIKARWEEEERLGVKSPRGGYEDSDSVWQRSFIAEDGPDVPVGLRLFAIGSRLAELTVDLKEPPEDRTAIDALSRDWGNLREVIGSTDAAQGAALIEPVLDRFCQTLADVSAAHDPLRPKCESLQRQLERFLEPPREPPPPRAFTDDDIPF